MIPKIEEFLKMRILLFELWNKPYDSSETFIFQTIVKTTYMDMNHIQGLHLE